MPFTIENLNQDLQLKKFVCILAVAVVGSWPTCSFAQDNEPQPVAAAQAVVEAEMVDEGQEFEDIEEGVEAVQVMNPWGVEPGKMKAAKRFELTQIFAVEVDEIQRVCDLDKKQALKLKIGTKGAVKKMTAEWLKSTNNQFAAMGGGQNNKQQEEEAEEIVINDADEIDEMTMQMMMNGMGNPFHYDDPRDHKFWKKTVHSVLSKEQEAKFKQFRIDQASVKRNGMIFSAISTLTVELGLTKEQVPKFEAIVRPPMEVAEIKCPSFYEPFVMYYHASKADEAKLKDLLGPSQLQKWKLFVAPSKQIGQMMEMENNGFVGADQNMDFWMEVDSTVTEIVAEVVSWFDSFAGK